MSKKMTPIAAALGAAFAMSLAAAPVSADTANPFGMSDLNNGYQQVAEGKCGEGKCGGSKAKGAKEAKCGEGKCGEGKKAGAKKAEGKCGSKKKEAKCGEGKCGGKK